MDVPSFMPILKWEARKLSYDNSFTAEDLVQEGVIAVMRALESYDPERGGVRGYIRVCARNRMISYLRRNGREYPAGDEFIFERLRSELDDCPPDAPDEIIERRETVFAFFSSLSPFERDVLGAYLKCGGVSGTALTLGCERKKVDNALQRIRVKARDQNLGESRRGTGPIGAQNPAGR
ncbi:MAG: sigma-70 family RNA polymerase sigma factor [Synergistaceae bacterium]|jgi:RNA polymerase sporulation-specific sigma factor|nr:sigma-70 family RNA polymerase sigma factor [Synergistaceae bacterium]